VYTGNKPKKIAAIVSNLFNDDQLLKEMSKKAKKQSHPEATKEIAKDIGDFVLRKTPELQLLNH
jgi:UDP-N-acetylglucosamine:LPS N-acetylglucosamine transferase